MATSKTFIAAILYLVTSVCCAQLTESDLTKLQSLSSQLEHVSQGELSEAGLNKMINILKQMINLYKKDPSFTAIVSDLEDQLAALAPSPHHEIEKQEIKKENEQTKTPIASELLRDQRSRIADFYGEGKFGANRRKQNGGTYGHKGQDFKAEFGETVYAPIDGTITFNNLPYGEEFDGYYKGLQIEGTGEWVGYSVKIFYVDKLPESRATVRAGDAIDTAQMLDLRFTNGRMTNHVHVEVRFSGQLIDPLELWQRSFK